MACRSSATGKTKPRSSGFRAAAKEGFDDIARGEFVSLRSGKEIDDFIDRLEVEASAHSMAGRKGARAASRPTHFRSMANFIGRKQGRDASSGKQNVGSGSCHAIYLHDRNGCRLGHIKT
jgi:hypothetical protein